MNGECISCGSVTEEIMNLGLHRLPDFPDPGGKVMSLYPFYPLRLMLCPECTLLQLNDLTPRARLYHDRYGFKSGINEAVRADLEDVVKSALPAVKRDFQKPQTWLDIGCNDGTLLSFVPPEITRTGIDPLGQFAEEAGRHADRIITDYFRADHFPGERFDVITAVSMFYDLADPGQFAEEVRGVLEPWGTWVIQQNYALDMILQNAIDNVCHEHVTYFTVAALKQLLERHGLEIFHVSYSAVNGGCFRAFAGHPGRHPVRDTVYDALADEVLARTARPSVWRRWAGDVRQELQKTADLLTARAVRYGNRVYLYGASTRGGTMLQLMGAGPSLLECAVERNPAKVGKIMASTGLRIISEEQMRKDDPEYLLVSPWFFRDVFLEREKEYLDNGGRMIFPLPHHEVVKR